MDDATQRAVSDGDESAPRRFASARVPAARQGASERMLGDGPLRDEDELRFADLLEDAEALVKYAAGAGIDVDDSVRRAVFVARSKAPGEWTEDEVSALLVALTTLSRKLRPVSGESARKCLIKDEAKWAIRTYEIVAAIVVAVILPVSYFSFVASAACDTIRTDIELANALAVTLHSQTFAPAAAPGPGPGPASGAGDASLGGSRSPNTDELTNMQQFAATIRDLRVRTKRLGKYDWIAGESKNGKPAGAAEGKAEGPEAAPASDELPVPVTDASATTVRLIKEYQNVRLNAQRVQEDVSTGFGALATCFLPSLYALLGACAYLARRFERQMQARTFTGAEKAWVRIFIAGIGGLVVGLFAKFGASQGASLPPLAIAFLVGYGADFFFVFLDGILQTFWRSQSDAPADARASGAAAKG